MVFRESTILGGRRRVRLLVPRRLFQDPIRSVTYASSNLATAAVAFAPVHIPLVVLHFEA